MGPGADGILHTSGKLKELNGLLGGNILKLLTNGYGFDEIQRCNVE